MTTRFAGRVQSGTGNASHWLTRCNAEYARKIGMAVFPGSLNIALGAPFDWFAPDVVQRTVTFDGPEYGGERDILLVPCRLENLDDELAWLRTTTTTACSRTDSSVVEIIGSRSLRAVFQLIDGSPVIIRLLDHAPNPQPDAAGSTTRSRT